MRHPAIVFLAVLAAASCADVPGTPTDVQEVTVPAFARGAGAAYDHAPSFTAHARGEEEVPPVETRAQGQAVFRLTDEGLAYRLMVANIENVTQSHIHMAAAGATGSVVAWLYPSGPPSQLIPGRTDGVLAQGVITAASLVGPLAGQDLEALLAALRSGGAYVNVHTQAHPPGEIRGQVH